MATLAKLERGLRSLLSWRPSDTHFFNYLALVLLAAALLVGAFVLVVPLPEFDLEFSREVQEHQFPLLDALMEAVSVFGNGLETVITAVVASAILWWRKLPRAAASTLATLAATPIILVLKVAFDRPRPTSDLVNKMYEATQQSFPSGHAVYYTLFFGFLLYLSFVHPMADKRWLRVFRLVLAALIVGVSFSRIYLGAHWATDVIAGYCIGALLLIVWCQGYARWYRTASGADKEAADEGAGRATGRA